MDKHTPGPWGIDGDDRPGMDWNNHIYSIPKPHMTICFMTHTGRKDNSECEANARLIAAAPELMDALESYVVNHPAFRSKPVGSPGSNARKEQEMEIQLEDKARAALAKAKGETT